MFIVWLALVRRPLKASPLLFSLRFQHRRITRLVQILGQRSIFMAPSVGVGCVGIGIDGVVGM